MPIKKPHNITTRSVSEVRPGTSLTLRVGIGLCLHYGIVSGKALAAGSRQYELAASALPLTHTKSRTPTSLLGCTE